MGDLQVRTLLAIAFNVDEVLCPIRVLPRLCSRGHASVYKTHAWMKSLIFVEPQDIFSSKKNEHPPQHFRFSAGHEGHGVSPMLV
jgi:hypothetical protein